MIEYLLVSVYNANKKQEQLKTLQNLSLCQKILQVILISFPVKSLNVRLETYTFKNNQKVIKLRYQRRLTCAIFSELDTQKQNHTLSKKIIFLELYRVDQNTYSLQIVQCKHFKSILNRSFSGCLFFQKKFKIQQRSWFLEI